MFTGIKSDELFVIVPVSVYETCFSLILLLSAVDVGKNAYARHCVSISIKIGQVSYKL